jgi:hypothetical protein
MMTGRLEKEARLMAATSSGCRLFSKLRISLLILSHMLAAAVLLIAGLFINISSFVSADAGVPLGIKWQAVELFNISNVLTVTIITRKLHVYMYTRILCLKL